MYKEHEHGIGSHSRTPYSPSTLEGYKVALVYAYRHAGLADHVNPACHAEVSSTLSVVSVILGEGRMALTEVISPELAQRIIGSLDARNLRHALVAVLLSHGLTLGERASTLALCDFGEITFSEDGVLIFTPYTKSDKTQVGETSGIPCCTTCDKSKHCSTVTGDDGCVYFDMAVFCPACVMMH